MLKWEKVHFPNYRLHSFGTKCKIKKKISYHSLPFKKSRQISVVKKHVWSDRVSVESNIETRGIRFCFLCVNLCVVVRCLISYSAEWLAQIVTSSVIMRIGVGLSAPQQSNLEPCCKGILGCFVHSPLVDLTYNICVYMISQMKTG